MTAVRAMAWSELRSEAASGVEALYRAEARSLVGMLTVYVGDRSLAEDITQEAFARVQQSWDRIREPDRLIGYLRTTAFNLARSSMRRRLRAERVPLARDVASPEDGLVLGEDQRAVVAAVHRLPRQQRACVILRYYAELGIDDIASALGISANSVKTHLVRALDALEVSLEGER